MGDLADFVESIVQVVVEVAEGIWTVISNINEWIKDHIGYINLALATLAVVAAVIVIPHAVMVYQAVMIETVASTTATLSGVNLITAHAAAMATGLKMGFAVFLEAIHFELILSIHSIAYLISPQYRNMITQVMQEISEVSGMLGLGPGFILLALENARNLVLTVSGLLGMSYDMAQIQWLSTLSNYLKDFQSVANKYRDNPGQLLLDMGDLITKPMLDQMGEYMTAIIQTLDNLIGNAEEIVNAVVTVRNEFDKLVSDLPADMKRTIKGHTDPIIKMFDGFISTQFTPTINAINGVINILDYRQGQVSAVVDNTVQRLRYPGNYLHEIDALSPLEKLGQEYQISEVANRPQRRFYEEMGREGDSIDAGLEALKEELKTIVPPPKYLVHEVPRPIRLPQIKIQPGDSWFVGDY